MAEFAPTAEAFLALLAAGEKKVGLRNVALSETDCAEIARIVALNLPTQRLSIVGGGLNAAKMIPILQALSGNTNVQYLNLNNNSGGTESAKALALVLEAGNQSLTEIFLTGNNVWQEGGLALLGALQDNSTVQIMDLDGNKVEKPTLKQISQRVEDNL